MKHNSKSNFLKLFLLFVMEQQPSRVSVKLWPDHPPLFISPLVTAASGIQKGGGEWHINRIVTILQAGAMLL